VLAHDIMAALVTRRSHKLSFTLRKPTGGGAVSAVTQLNDRKANILSQTALERLRKVIKNGVKSE
jgi:hypothetical protein